MSEKISLWFGENLTFIKWRKWILVICQKRNINSDVIFVIFSCLIFPWNGSAKEFCPLLKVEALDLML